jgi:hypothetical protein
MVLGVLLLLAVCLPARAAVVYSGIQNLTVPITLDGLFLNVATGSTTGTYPADWNNKPYFNPFYGGVAVATSDLFLPVIMGADQLVNVTYSSLIDDTLNYAVGESGSSTHIGAGAGQFVLNTQGYVGFEFQATVGGPTMFGWARVTFANTGGGTIHDWAYNDSGYGILAGTLLVVPEPQRALLIFGGLLMPVFVRRRAGPAGC